MTRNLLNRGSRAPIDLDTSTGLNYLNNRYMDPTTGEFISVDPLVSKTGDPYLYSAGNPTTLSDPTGLSPADVCAFSAGGTKAGACTSAMADLVVGCGSVLSTTACAQAAKWVPSGCASNVDTISCALHQDPVESAASPDGPSGSWAEQSRIIAEIKAGLTSIDPDGFTVGVCGGGDVALIAAYGDQGCIVTDSDGMSLVNTFSEGFGTPSLGLSAGWISATSDVGNLKGDSLCFGGSAFAATGTVCGSIQYSEQDGLWHATGATSVFYGGTIDTSEIVPGAEIHAVYGHTSAYQLINYDWFKPWTWF